MLPPKQVPDGGFLKRRAVMILILHLFSGPGGRPDGFKAEVERRGGSCLDYDWIIDKVKMDSCDDQNWDRLKEELHTFDGAQLDPPCNTFSNASNWSGFG